MTYTMQEALEFVRDRDVKFIRLAFCDMLGVQKNISIMPNELERAFESGISFDASSIDGFMDVSRSDLFLWPDPSTLNVLPWRPQQGRVVRFFCDVKYPDGTLFDGNARNALKDAVQRCRDMGYLCKIGSECEFYLFKTDEDGDPTLIPHDHGGYLDIAPMDRGENVRREICLCLEEMGIKPEASHHERGPGQHEVDFQYGNPLIAADSFITFKSVVKAIAARNGLYASFLPKPLSDQSGSGLHINVSLSQNGSNLFRNDLGEWKTAQSFVAGVLDKMLEITAILNPLPNSYARFGRFEAPKYISWSQQNRSQLIRIPAASEEYARMELRSPDSACNPYAAFALIMNAGLDGIEKDLELPNPLNQNMYTAGEDVLKSRQALPSSLEEAVEYMEGSEFVNKVLGESFISKYAAIKKWECEDFARSDAGYDKATKYFRMI